MLCIYCNIICIVQRIVCANFAWFPVRIENAKRHITYQKINDSKFVIQNQFPNSKNHTINKRRPDWFYKIKHLQTIHPNRILYFSKLFTNFIFQSRYSRLITSFSFFSFQLKNIRKQRLKFQLYRLGGKKQINGQLRTFHAISGNSLVMNLFCSVFYWINEFLAWFWGKLIPR